MITSEANLSAYSRGEELRGWNWETGKSEFTVKIKPYANENSVNLVFYRRAKNGDLQEVQSVEVSAIAQRFAVVDFDLDGTPEIISLKDYDEEYADYRFDFVKWNAKAKRFERTAYFKDGEGSTPEFSADKKLVFTSDYSNYSQSLYSAEKGKLKKLYDFRIEYAQNGYKLTLNDGKKSAMSVFEPTDFANLQPSEKQSLLKNLTEMQNAIKKFYK